MRFARWYRLPGSAILSRQHEWPWWAGRALLSLMALLHDIPFKRPDLVINAISAVVTAARC